MKKKKELGNPSHTLNLDDQFQKFFRSLEDNPSVDNCQLLAVSSIGSLFIKVNAKN